MRQSWLLRSASCRPHQHSPGPRRQPRGSVHRSPPARLQLQQLYENPEGKTAAIQFLGLHDLNVVHDELAHGTELSYREFRTTDDSTIREWVSSKENLGFFAPMRRRTGPDYTSKEVMDEVRKRLDQPPPPATDPTIH